MTSSAMPSAVGATRRLVLVDFDWQDADLVPQLLRHPGVSVRLVAGARPDDPGVRLAELCGLPRTVDLADLTREIFDLAVVSERSPRRTQIEGLLLALGTPSVSPRSFLDGETPAGESTPAVEAPLELHAAAFETTIGGEAFDSLVERALPDISQDAPTAPSPVRPTGRHDVRITNLNEFPSQEDRRGLEAALKSLVADTGAGNAELYVGANDHLELVVQVGKSDPLLKGLIELAVQLGTPQVVSSLSGEKRTAKAWGAWPFKTAQRRGVLAASGIDPAEGWTSWQRTVDDLRTTWDEQDRERAGAAFPLIPQPKSGWLAVDDFRTRLELATERNARDGLKFSLHRLTFPAASVALDKLADRLPGQLRDTDCICRPTNRIVLLLTPGPRDNFVHLRRRLVQLWQDVWEQAGNARPAPGITDERIDMTAPDEAASFMSRAEAWFSAT
jgi:hypothetical protein